MMSTPFELDADPGRLSGRRSTPPGASLGDTPLIVALHGGSYSSAFFDVPGHSLLEQCAANGCTAVALDRPGYGGSTLLEGAERWLPLNARWLSAGIAKLWRDAPSSRGVVIVGHSIGAAVAIIIAGEARDWPLLGISISGIGMVYPDDGPPFVAPERPPVRIDVPVELKNAAMFGPPGTYDADAPQLAASANEPVIFRDILDINTWWPEHAKRLCASVDVPVHYRQGEYDRIWSQSPDDYRNFAAAFSGAPSIDAAIADRAGHSIDLHKVGASFRAEQIAFARQCAA